MLFEEQAILLDNLHKLPLLFGLKDEFPTFCFQIEFLLGDGRVSIPQHFINGEYALMPTERPTVEPLRSYLRWILTPLLKTLFMITKRNSFDLPMPDR